MIERRNRQARNGGAEQRENKQPVEKDCAEIASGSQYERHFCSLSLKGQPKRFDPQDPLSVLGSGSGPNTEGFAAMPDPRRDN